MFKATIEDIEELVNRLKKSLGSDYSVETDKEISDVFKNKEKYNIVIYYKKETLMAIKILNEFYSLPVSNSALVQHTYILNKLNRTDIKFFVYYLGEKNIYLYDKEIYNDFLKVPFDDVIDTIKCRKLSRHRPKINEVIEELKFRLNDISLILPDYLLSTLEKVKSFLNKESIFYDEEEKEIHFKTTVEDEFFNLFLPKVKDKQICRYTSVNNLFKTLQNKNHCMLTITCMNDRGELTYADEKVGAVSRNDSPSKERVKEDNECFILSCCDIDKVDNLTFWRLYGDNAKGVCLIYEVDENLIDNKRFFFSPVSYGNEDGRHYDLEIIRAIMNIDFNGWKFVFKRWHIWKHFFKSSIFTDENEIRLLYKPGVDKDGFSWIRDNSNGIISRIKTFGINDDKIKFPLKLRKVIVGPKCNELDSVVSQLNYMNKCQGVIDIKNFDPIVKSNIEDYR